VLELTIPGAGTLRLQHLVLDFNGTLACDGVLLQGVRARIDRLSEQLQVHVLTADTFGTARDQLRELPCEITLLPAQEQSEAKRAYVQRINPGSAVCIGNGMNDRLMLEHAALSIAVVQEEGAAVATLQAADVVARNILDALDLLLNPQRLVATLRR
jgi:soluble P-type ATPase